MTEDLAEALGDRESTVLEFKSTFTDRDRLGQAICALANDLCGDGGGDLLIGVDDHGNPTSDIQASDDELLKLTDLRDCGLILDRPSMTVQAATFKGVRIIRVHVENTATPPVRYKGIIWVRPGPTTRRASRDDERILAERRQAHDGPYDVSTVSGSSIEDLDMAAFRSDYLPSMVDPDVIEENHRSDILQLASLRLVGPGGTPTALGHLVLGFDPTRFIPGAYLQFVRYDGVEVDTPILDDQELRQNVVDLPSRLDALLRGHLHTRLVETDGFREETRPDYPLAALREACMNAVMHRNYETSHAPTRILWFSDRIEITNPGGPYGQVRTDNFDRTCDYRNPSLAAAMKSLGYVNRFGRGINRILAEVERNGNPAAEFSIDESSWSVTLRKV